jgi:hypothetical protein
LSNDSSTGGYLSPSSAPPLEDTALDFFLQGAIVGIIGLPVDMVRRRWQPTVPKEPENTVDWCAIGVVSETPEYSAYTRHWRGEPSNPNDHAGQGYDEQIRHEVLEIMASFYGPNSRGNAKLFRDGISVAQNRESFYLQNMNFVSTDCKMVNAPELINEKWFRRVDLTFLIRREIDRTYPVLNILSAPITIKSDTPNATDSFSAGPLPPQV